MAKRSGGMISGMSEKDALTVGDIRDAIEKLSDDVEIDFGSTLEGRRLHFYRFKTRGKKFLGIELREELPDIG